ncbi:hypothetical protein [Demequina lignilytica]|uniref:Membrane protein YfhO n=1 Tax=Demequina lignilytica TaxID=3051663 RepID=A0AB35MKH3_9MICO|nr:hypothetical protein [Demequina sp. SYSU T0a273]MDN4484309.1 hypothetical protein [Demequina sp. SYSU T0a273]
MRNATIGDGSRTATQAETSLERRAGAWHHVDHAVGALAIGGVVTAVLLLHRGTGFFATDDAINEFLPYLHEIGRIWAGGHVPTVTANSFSGGNYLIDFHRTPFHPLTIALGLLFYSTGKIGLTSAVFAFVITTATAYGAYGAARALGVRRVLAHGVALASATSPVLLFVYTSAWWNGALATATFTFVAWAAFAVLRRPRGRTVAAFFLASTLLFYSGWPIALVQYALFGIVVLFALWRGRAFGVDVPADGRGRRALALIGGALAAVLVAVPQVSEYLANGDLLDRVSEVGNEANRGVVTWLQLAGAAHPTGGDFWLSLGGDYQYWALPVGFVSVLVALAIAAPTRWRDLRGTAAPALAATAAVMALLTQLPQQFGPLLYPFRSITAVGFFVVLLAATVLTHSRGPWSRNRVLAVAAGYVVLAGVFIFRIPDPLDADRRAVAISVVVAILVVGLLALALASRRRTAAFAAAALLGPALVVLAVAPLFPQPAGALARALTSASAAAVPRAEDGLIAQIGAEDNDAWPAYHASRYLIAGSAILNGYDPVRQAAYAAALRVSNPKGFLRPSSLEYLAQPSDIEDRCRIDDLGVVAISSVVELPVEQVDALERCGFVRDRVGTTDVFTGGSAAGPAGGPTTRDQGLEVALVTLEDARVVVDVSNAADAAARLNFSRMWWPGYRATLDGTPLDVTPVDGFSVQVAIPAGASGELTLEYTPRSWGWSLPVGALGVALAGALAAFFAVLRRRQETDATLRDRMSEEASA